MIAQESRPTLIAAWATRRSLRQVLAHRPRGNPQAELQQQFVGDALFAPAWIFGRHAPDQRLGPNHHHGITPIEEPGKQRQRHPCRGVNAPGPERQHNEAGQVGE